jgi:hypothetical protein
MMISVDKRRNEILAIASIIMLIAAAFNIIWLVVALTQIIDIKVLLRNNWVITPFPYLILNVGFGGNMLLSSILAIVFILGMIFSIIGGIFALRRYGWGLALIGSLGSIVCLPLLGVVAIIFIASSKRQFVKVGN